MKNRSTTFCVCCRNSGNGKRNVGFYDDHDLYRQLIRDHNHLKNQRSIFLPQAETSVYLRVLRVLCGSKKKHPQPLGGAYTGAFIVDVNLRKPEIVEGSYLEKIIYHRVTQSFFTE